MRHPTLVTRNLRRFSLVLGALCLSGLSCAAQIIPTVVAPSGASNTEGNGSNAFPFGIAGSGLSRQRYQQLYDASLFAGIGPGFITQLVFRPDASASPFSCTLPAMQINLSTTQQDDHLLFNFAKNIGPDNTVVFDRGSLTLSTDFTGPPGGPKDFDLVIDLTTPFFYDPSQGNLLLEIWNYGGGNCPSFDSVIDTGDEVVRVFTTKRLDNRPATWRDTYGLVTGFTIVPAQ
jgi:hypothetical protein